VFEEFDIHTGELTISPFTYTAMKLLKTKQPTKQKLLARFGFTAIPATIGEGEKWQSERKFCSCIPPKIKELILFLQVFASNFPLIL